MASNNNRKNKDSVMSESSGYAFISAGSTSDVEPFLLVSDDVGYVIKVSVTDRKHAGTDDTVTIVLFGVNGSSRKFKLDNPKIDDFKRGRVSTFEFNANEYNVGGDLGPIYAIALGQEGSDAIYLDYVEVDYKVGEDVSHTSRFSISGAMGDKGDFNLTADRKNITKLSDDIREMTPNVNITQEVGAIWVVIDNRRNSVVHDFNETVNQTLSTSTFYGRLTQEETTQHYGFAYEAGGWFGPDYQFTVDITHSRLEQVTQTGTLDQSIAHNIQVAQQAAPNTLVFLRYVITANGSYDSYSGGESMPFDVNILTATPGFNNSGVSITEYGQYDDLPDDMKRIYQMVLNKNFTQIEGAAVSA